jgi:hypothetical protein
MNELFSTQDAATPINSAGVPTQPYGNAAGEFDLKNKYGSRKVKSRKDLDQPKDGEEPMRDGTLPKYGEGPLATGGNESDDSTKRYFGDFSIEAKRNVFDLLKNHPEFDCPLISSSTSLISSLPCETKSAACILIPPGN